ncbi:hypothetical protein [Aeoliella sp.]|uniref:hypothetical protein n=1 Tax=Aeoliella sp. TaxID=2795800 RepID=UPI003CCC2E96
MNLLRHAVVFVVLATVLLAIVGCLARGGIISFNLDLDQAPLDAGTQRFVRAWLRLGLVLGVVTPLVVCLCWLRSSDVRQTLGVYVMVLVAQIATEVMMRRLFFTSMLVIIGTTYTAYRLWQLWRIEQVLGTSEQLSQNARRLMMGLLYFLVAFWTVNLTVVLLGIEWPRLFVEV